MLQLSQKRGPQRSVDCIVSAAFIITLCLVSFLCMELLKVKKKLKNLRLEIVQLLLHF